MPSFSGFGLANIFPKGDNSHFTYVIGMYSNTAREYVMQDTGHLRMRIAQVTCINAVEYYFLHVKVILLYRKEKNSPMYTPHAQHVHQL